jgi:hypothetical protein
VGFAAVAVGPLLMRARQEQQVLDTGVKVRVRYDPADPSKVALVGSVPTP